MTQKIGIVGYGLRGGLAKHAHRPEDGSTVTIVCDTSERGRADAAEAFPEATITADLTELLDSGIDAVLVLTPDHTHHAIVRLTLAAGIATFCEKPLAVTVSDATELLQIAYDNRTRLYVGHNMRHMPVVTQMRELIRSGRIGEVTAIWCRHFVGHGGDFYFKDWHADRRNTTSLLLQKAAHDIDVIHWLAGGYTRRVSAMGALQVYGRITDRRDRTGERMGDWSSVDNWPPLSQTGLNPVVDVEDLSMVHMDLDGGVLASYQQCHYTPDYWRNYTVIGTQGRLENQGDGAGGRIEIWDRRHPGWAAPDATIPIEAGAGGHGGADPVLIGEFLRFAREGGDTETSPVAAWQSVVTGVLATQSLRSDGSALDVPRLPREVEEYFNAGQPT
ncbi:Gfo/Idh/MocA family protein [Pseudactinotalea sp. Z1748]|uniref:Gfo/Idh/MocA family protein n=1 Tax=Pseudactinotalea sp. Z1748 TaxID=3413027 RepID=UPI003C7CECC9